MKISVVVPVYNVEEYIVDCLESIVHQSYQDLEIILVDDGSTDKSGIICDEYAKRDNRITVIHKENGGLVSARKAGVALATGEYTSYVDSDDWIDRDMYERLVSEIENDHTDILIFGSKKEYSNRTEVHKELLPAGDYHCSQWRGIIERHIKENEYFYAPIVAQHLWSKLFRTDIIKGEQIKVDNIISMGEDFLSYACIKRAQTIKVIDIQPYHYRVRQSSIVHKRTEYEQYHALFVYLTRLIEGYEYARPLFVQCVYYMLSLIDASKVVLFPILTKEDRVVVYGKGVMGKSMLQGLQEQQACQIVNWVDSSSIDELIEMSSESYDYILIAITGHELVRKIEQLICDKGIDSKKIMRIHPKDLQEENLPEDIKKIIQLEDF